MLNRFRMETLTAALVTVILWALFPSPASAQIEPGYSIEMSRMIPMRDGVELEAWIFKPANLKSGAPTVLNL
ncbi:MAG: hypothetical protein WA197_25695, partial [Candidatus Acidiferrales bacterium]